MNKYNLLIILTILGLSIFVSACASGNDIAGKAYTKTTPVQTASIPKGGDSCRVGGCAGWSAECDITCSTSKATCECRSSYGAYCSCAGAATQ
jgi:hypothetical protein